MWRTRMAAVGGCLAMTAPAAAAAAPATKAPAKPKRRVIVQTRTFTGPLTDASDWGQVEVRLEFRKTTTVVGTRRTIARHMFGLGVPVWPDHAARSIEINDQALPVLVREALQAQSAAIDLVSGATYTSDAFQQSLQAALLEARAW